MLLCTRNWKTYIFIHILVGRVRAHDFTILVQISQAYAKRTIVDPQKRAKFRHFKNKKTHVYMHTYCEKKREKTHIHSGQKSTFTNLKLD